MVDGGLQVKNFSTALYILKTLDKKTASSEETLKLFLAYTRADVKLLEIGLKEMNELPPQIQVKPIMGAIALLQELRKSHQLVLVTAGSVIFQKAKWENAGIDSKVFSKIAIATNGVKKIYYEQILREFHAKPAETIVIGDRVKKDLKPAKDLGCLTIHMKWGRGRLAEGTSGVIDYAISNLNEIQEILMRKL